MARFAALLAAAGLGRRAGGPKVDLILSDDPRPLLERCIAGLFSAGASAVFATVRQPWQRRVEAAGAIAVVPKPPPDQMIMSYRASLAALQAHALCPGLDGILVAPVDAPAAIEAAGAWLPAALSTHPGAAIVPAFAGCTGHPAWLPRDLWGNLAAPRCAELGARAAFSDAEIWETGDRACLQNINQPLPD